MRRMLAGMLGGLFALAAAQSHAEMSAEELAKLAQNPVGNLISVPFQFNYDLKNKIENLCLKKAQQEPGQTTTNSKF